MYHRKMVYRDKETEASLFKFISSIPKEMLCFPLDVFNIVSAMPKCKIHSYQDFSLRHSCDVREVASFCDSNTGAVHKDSNDNYIIMFNDDASISPRRKSFTIAHEVGHIQLQHFLNLGDSKISENNNRCKNIHKEMERKANHFAAYLLCPIPLAYELNIKSLPSIQRNFGLSNDASEIASYDCRNYDRNFHISWHNDMVKLFSSSF